MPGVFALIGQSYAFCRKQSALIGVGFWLLFLPLSGINLLASFIKEAHRNIGAENGAPLLLSALCVMLLGILLMWGVSCVLVIGSRLLAAKAGRSRTSFKAVRTEAKAFIIPLILTGLLRGIITLLWGMLLIIPGVIYSIRTIFFSIIIVDEGIGYRPALRKSRDIVRGHTFPVIMKILLMSLFLFIPVRIFVEIFTLLVFTVFAEPGLPLVDILDGALSAAALTLFTISTILLYGSLRPQTAPITNTKVKTFKK
jgi:hypothetical protein